MWKQAKAGSIYFYVGRITHTSGDVYATGNDMEITSEGAANPRATSFLVF